MTPDEIISAFEIADLPPADALRAAVTQADALAQRIYDVVQKLCRGVYLLPADSRVLSYGLPALAAARHAGLREQVLALVRVPEEDLDNIYPDRSDVMLARLLLSVWDDEDDVIFQMIEHADLSEPGRWALFDVLARLTFDGRIARDRTLDFLTRFERDRIAGDDDTTWWSWEDAVTRLGLTELEPALRRVWGKGINKDSRAVDRDESLAELSHAAAHPADAAAFDAVNVRAIDDPTEAMAWAAQKLERMTDDEGSTHETIDSAEGTSTPSASELTDDESDWLGGFLESRQVPDSTMTLEMLDGFLTALVIGPSMVTPSEYLAEIWGTENGEGPAWDSPAQTAYFMGLIGKLWNTVADRRMADATIEPLMLELPDDVRGMDWAAGFQVGIEMRAKDWEPLARVKRGNELVMAIMLLTGDHDDAFDTAITPKKRAEILDDLPVILQMIAAYWRDGEAAFPQRTPARSNKVGRNDPCPCGSGKKYKKCCAGTTPATIH